MLSNACIPQHDYSGQDSLLYKPDTGLHASHYVSWLYVISRIQNTHIHKYALLICFLSTTVAQPMTIYIVFFRKSINVF